MKKLWLLTVALFALCACSKDNTDSVENPAQRTKPVPHFYGWMTLDDPAPDTRSVANNWKVWSKPIAKNDLTVKFLNGNDRYQQYVREVAAEWEKYADVKFNFITDDQPAMIRIGFDYVRGMRSSWALTGTDHMQKYGNQNEATVHFAEWARTSEAVRRSDVLRAFGQVLGLELEFRHPDFEPEWITDADGNIDELTIREYWESELNELISWEELRKVVLEPLSSQAFSISKTETYDPKSVMAWPFLERIIQNIAIVEFPEDYNTELSEMDKAFIGQLYGKPEVSAPEETFPIKLISFNSMNKNLKFTVSTSKDLVVYWNYKEGTTPAEAETSHIKIPEGAEIPYTVTVEHSYTNFLVHHVVICEMVKEIPEESSALERFDLVSGAGMSKLNIQPQIPNVKLSYVRVQGGKGFLTQQFNFENNPYLKELYMTQIGDSKVNIDNCENLEVFSTAPYLCKLRIEKADNQDNKNPSAVGAPDRFPIYDLIINRPDIRIPVEVKEPDTWDPRPPFDSLAINKGGNWILTPADKNAKPWPTDPLQHHSLTEGGLTISNCPKFNSLCLENTCITTLDFSNWPQLSYLYLSSCVNNIVDCGSNAESVNLRNAIATLPKKLRETPGQIIIRGLFAFPEIAEPYRYKISALNVNEISQSATEKNWAICWDPQFEYSTEN